MYNWEKYSGTYRAGDDTREDMGEKQFDLYTSMTIFTDKIVLSHNLLQVNI